MRQQQIAINIIFQKFIENISRCVK